MSTWFIFTGVAALIVMIMVPAVCYITLFAVAMCVYLISTVLLWMSRRLEGLMRAIVGLRDEYAQLPPRRRIAIAACACVTYIVMFLLTGCIGADAAKAFTNLKDDNAAAEATVDSIYGKMRFFRANPRPGQEVFRYPDGTIQMKGGSSTSSVQALPLNQPAQPMR